MYSVVLMMAMTTSVDAPDSHRHGCCGCTGAVAAPVCAPVATSCCGCEGGHHRHRLFGHRHHGCAGCSGVVNSCGCTGAVVVTGCTGCAGGVAAPAPVLHDMPVKPAPKPEPIKPAPKSGALNGPATIYVTLPANATLSIDGAATTSTSSERVFVSPELQAGRTFSYTLKAEFQNEGKPVVVSKIVNVSAGAESRVSFSTTELAGVASR